MENFVFPKLEHLILNLFIFCFKTCPLFGAQTLAYCVTYAFDWAIFSFFNARNKNPRDSLRELRTICGCSFSHRTAGVALCVRFCHPPLLCPFASSQWGRVVVVVKYKTGFPDRKWRNESAIAGRFDGGAVKIVVL